MQADLASLPPTPAPPLVVAMQWKSRTPVAPCLPFGQKCGPTPCRLMVHFPGAVCCLPAAAYVISLQLCTVCTTGAWCKTCNRPAMGLLLGWCTQAQIASNAVPAHFWQFRWGTPTNCYCQAPAGGNVSAAAMRDKIKPQLCLFQVHDRSWRQSAGSQRRLHVGRQHMGGESSPALACICSAPRTDACRYGSEWLCNCKRHNTNAD